MLEKMGAFFDARLEGYEEHQLSCIESAREFYPFTAGCLPRTADAAVLDLGCGTGLELGYYFEIVPTAKITGIDLAPGMLAALRRKFPGKALKLMQAPILTSRWSPAPLTRRFPWNRCTISRRKKRSRCMRRCETP